MADSTLPQSNSGIMSSSIFERIICTPFVFLDILISGGLFVSLFNALTSGFFLYEPRIQYLPLDNNTFL
jgi:hypothetical protein